MARRALIPIVAALALAAGACDDPVVVLGDWPNTMRVFAGVPDSPGVRVDTAATRALLTTPYAVAVTSDAGAYIADAATRRVLFVTSGGRASVVLDHRSCIVQPCLVQPAALAVAPGGALLIADIGGHRVLRLAPGSPALEVLAGTGVAGDSPDGAAAASSPIRAPAGIGVGADGRVYFTERDRHVLRAIDDAGGLVTVAGTGTSGTGGDGGPATAAQLSDPTAIVFGPGALYVADTGRHRVRVIDVETGVIGTVAGVGAAGYGGDGGAAIAARLDRPLGLALSDDGAFLYIADSNNHRVRAVTLADFTIRTYAGTGSPIFSGSGGAAGVTTVDRPAGLAFDRFGQLYIADTGHNIVWRVPVR